MDYDPKPHWHSRGYLPHYDGGLAVQHIVMHTTGALDPSEFAPQPKESEVARLMRIDQVLDHSRIGRFFAAPEAATAMEASLLHFDGHSYDLLAWCVMPNHVHVILIVHRDQLLGTVVKSWKVHATRVVNQQTGHHGRIFVRDYFDRHARSRRQMMAMMSYVESNPVAAGLCRMPADWRWCSAWHKARGWQPDTARCPLWLN